MSVCAPSYLNGACPLTSVQELNNILTPLPVGCSLLVHTSLFYFVFRLAHAVCILQAILDTTYSGTLLNLPHYHCNDVYVPWQSKGERRARTLHNINGLCLHHVSLSSTLTIT